MANKKNKIVIDLGEIDLTNLQRKSLLEKLHNTVSKKIKAVAVANARPAANNSRAAAPEKITKTANLLIDFFDADAGNSHLKATYQGVDKTLEQSGTISFENVNSNKKIIIHGVSPGTTTVTVTSVKTSPAQMSFPIGDIDGSFLIL